MAVAVAHGYAKASGTAGVTAVHDLVGLMHASMGIYNACCDQVPLVVIGGSGPSDLAERRPIDWTHSASTQGLWLVRDYVKWNTEVPSPLTSLRRGAASRSDRRDSGQIRRTSKRRRRSSPPPNEAPLGFPS
ncbi:MAG: hypothetical protein GEU93_21050 [Propionibacteriales bacterium]|nr:hypothetical protein [Propionibacteriales bacterium]